MTQLTHFDEKGQTQMVDVSPKLETERIAVAKGRVCAQNLTIQRIEDRDFSKGDVLEVARLAGIMSTKRTSDLIPLCHAIPITGVTIHLSTNLAKSCVEIEANVKSIGRTGVEMEALSGVNSALLAIYDLSKIVEPNLKISNTKPVSYTHLTLPTSDLV